MSLVNLDNGWKRFSNGHKWRIAAPSYLCEVDDEGNIPCYTQNTVVNHVKRVKSCYLGKLQLGRLDEFGTGTSIITANSFTESLGTVPSPVSTDQLKNIFNNAAGSDVGAKLHQVLLYLKSTHGAYYLERREPGYVSPTSTPARVSVGAHHPLISTALSMIGSKPGQTEADIIDLVLKLPSQSVFAAQIAIQYFNTNYSRHFNQPPLLAATYNAGSPRYTSSNAWNLVQYGDHLDRWISYYNTAIKA
jgi:hypothetical protein